MKPTKSPHLIVRKSRIHNRGGFARKDILEGTRVIEYVGPRLTKSQSDTRADELIEANEKDGNKGSVYIFELNKRTDIDGSVSWNTAKWINHSCDPNCETDIIRGRIWIIALKDIKKGEEITYDYGYDIEDFDDHPCKCGSKKCVGFIVAEEDWPKLKQRLRYRAQKKKSRKR